MRRLQMSRQPMQQVRFNTKMMLDSSVAKAGAAKAGAAVVKAVVVAKVAHNDLKPRSRNRKSSFPRSRQSSAHDATGRRVAILRTVGQAMDNAANIAVKCVRMHSRMAVIMIATATAI